MMSYQITSNTLSIRLSCRVSLHRKDQLPSSTFESDHEDGKNVSENYNDDIGDDDDGKTKEIS